MHVWAISSDYNALSCHIVVDDGRVNDSRHIVEEAKAALKGEFNIQHSTVEVEFKDCIAHADHELEAH